MPDDVDAAWSHLVEIEWAEQRRRLSPAERRRVDAWISHWGATRGQYLERFFAAVARGDAPVTATMAPPEAMEG